MSASAGHHELPWVVEECVPGAWDGNDRCEGISDADGDRVVTTDSGVYEPDLATARFIVRAVNSHYELLAALKGLLAIPGVRDVAEVSVFGSIVYVADAAIAKAEGSTAHV